MLSLLHFPRVWQAQQILWLITHLSGRSWSSIPSSAGSLPRWPARCGACHFSDFDAPGNSLNSRHWHFGHVRLRAFIIGWRTWPSSFASKKLGTLRDHCVRKMYPADAICTGFGTNPWEVSCFFIFLLTPWNNSKKSVSNVHCHRPGRRLKFGPAEDAKGPGCTARLCCLPCLPHNHFIVSQILGLFCFCFFPMFPWFRNRCVFGLPFSSFCIVFPQILVVLDFLVVQHLPRGCRRWRLLVGPLRWWRQDNQIHESHESHCAKSSMTSSHECHDPVKATCMQGTFLEGLWVLRTRGTRHGWIYSWNIVSASMRSHTQSCFFYFLFIFFKQRQRDKHMSPYALCHYFWCLMSQFSHPAIFQARQIFGGNAYTRSGLGEKAPTWWVSHVGLLEVCESIRQNQTISPISSK